MGNGNPSVSRGRNGRANSGHNLKWNPVLGQLQGLLTAPAKDEGVAAFEPDHSFSGGATVDQEPIDLLLGQRLPPPRFAYEDPFRRLRGRLEQRGIQQTVVDYYVRLLQAAKPFNRNQAWVARARAHQIDFTSQRPTFHIS